uniref:Uncharacterized protein n=1 Tax=viral metagenome TaxID=1070528 RepID=A0A6M3L3R2_9ZZZZ
MITSKEREWIECHFMKLQEQLTLVRIEIAKLKVKSGIWGVIGGTIPVIILIAIYFIARR